MLPTLLSTTVTKIAHMEGCKMGCVAGKEAPGRACIESIFCDHYCFERHLLVSGLWCFVSPMPADHMERRKGGQRGVEVALRPEYLLSFMCHALVSC